MQAIQFIGSVCGILVAPTIGILSDRTTSKYGRRRAYILCAVGSVICYILMGNRARPVVITETDPRARPPYGSADGLLLPLSGYHGQPCPDTDIPVHLGFRS